KRDRIQAAVEPVTPLVIDAGVLGGIARRFTPNHRPAVSAAIDEGVDRAVGGAVDDDRRVADLGRAEISILRDLRREGEEMPGRTAKDPLLLLLVGLGIVIKPVGHSTVIERRPDLSGQHRPSRANAWRMIVADDHQSDNGARPSSSYIPRYARRTRSSAISARCGPSSTTSPASST